MPEQKKSRITSRENSAENLPVTKKDAHKKLSPAAKTFRDDSAEMFRGLFTGDEHYHSRGTDFIPLWG